MKIVFTCEWLGFVFCALRSMNLDAKKILSVPAPHKFNYFFFFLFFRMKCFNFWWKLFGAVDWFLRWRRLTELINVYASIGGLIFQWRRTILFQCGIHDAVKSFEFDINLLVVLGAHNLFLDALLPIERGSIGNMNRATSVKSSIRNSKKFQCHEKLCKFH